MANKDLRDWIEGVKAAGELKAINGAEPKEEIGGEERLFHCTVEEHLDGAISFAEGGRQQIAARFGRRDPVADRMDHPPLSERRFQDAVQCRLQAHGALRSAEGEEEELAVTDAEGSARDRKSTRLNSSHT